jgi:hypothetical protein
MSFYKEDLSHFFYNPPKTNNEYGIKSKDGKTFLILDEENFNHVLRRYHKGDSFNFALNEDYVEFNFRNTYDRNFTTPRIIEDKIMRDFMSPITEHFGDDFTGDVGFYATTKDIKEIIADLFSITDYVIIKVEDEKSISFKAHSVASDETTINYKYSSILPVRDMVKKIGVDNLYSTFSLDFLREYILRNPSKEMHFVFQKNSPMKIQIKLGEKNISKFMIAPRIEEEEWND